MAAPRPALSHEMLRFLGLSILLGISLPLLAEEARYISDQLQTAVRSGASPRHRIIEFIRSGQRVEWLEDNLESGYSQIKTPSGKTGWVATPELMLEPAAREQLTALQGDKARFAQIQSELLQTQQALQKLQTHNQRQTQELAELRQAAAQPQQLLADNQTLREQHIQLAHERDMLRQEVQTLKQRNAQDWFIIGAGVLLAGILLGVLLPRLRLGQRRRWNEL